MKILIAVDGSPYTRRALAYLAAHDQWLGAHHSYTVIHVTAGLPHRAAAFKEADYVRALYEEDAQAVFRPIRAYFAMDGLRARFVSRIGHPARHIARLAQRGGFDLVIMGSHGHGATAGLVLGSVSTEVLARCTTPVLVIR
ncbi:MAG: universal stress protein [Burkholderiales bacterium]|nr:MAG: universal stress protein [Burkholderiales bacterium]